MRGTSYYRTAKHYFGEIGSWSGFFVAILASLFFGWFPDSIKDILTEFFPEFSVSLSLLFLSVVVILILAFLIRRIIKRIESLKYEVETYDTSELKKVKAIMMGLSIPREDNKLGLNWGQQEVLLKTCLQQEAKLQKIVIIPSNDSNKYAQDFINYLCSQTGLIPCIFEVESPVDYEDMISLQRTFNGIVEKLRSQGFREKEMLVDITAGTKTFSVVASSITFDNDIRMCYVNNHKQVVIFDMVLVKES